MSPFPYPFPGGAPRFPSRHVAQSLINEYKAHGRIRKCAHVRLGEWGGMVDPEEYGPECAQNSFLLFPDPAAAPFELAEEMFHGCPPNCHFYSPAWRARLWSGLTAVGRVALWCALAPLRLVRWVLTWYQGLPAATQIALLLVILLLVGILQWQQVVEIVKAFKGK